MSLLQKMQEQVDQLWQKVIYAKSDEERAKYRKEYQLALENFKKQSVLMEGLGSAETSSAPIAEPKDPTSISTEDVKAALARMQFTGEAPPSPFDFPDYIEFILAWLRHYRDKDQGALPRISKDTGIPPQSIVKILKRNRRVKADEHKKLLKYLSLSASESAFLDALFVLSETDSTDERVKVMEQLSNFSPFKKNNPREYEVWRYLSHWYYVAIYEMASLPNFKADPEWIQTRLRSFVPIPNIRKALIFLEGAKFIRITEKGKVISLKRNVQCIGGVYRLALRQFHLEMLEQAAGSIARVPSDRRRILSHTMAVPKDKEEALFKILEETIEKIANLGAGEQEQDEIFHVELAGFPLTKKSDIN